MAELDGVGDQIEQDLQDQLAVGARDHLIGAGFERDLDSALQRLGLAHADALARHLDKIDLALLEGELVRLGLGEIQDVVDDREKVIAAGGDVLDVGGIVLVAERTEGLPVHDVREADDRVQGRAQLMAHIGEEFALGVVGLVGLDQKRVGDLVLGLDRAVGDIALAGLGFLDVAGHQPHRARHGEEEIVGDQVGDRQRIEHDRRDFIGQHQQHRDDHAGDEIHPDQAVAIDHHHDQAGIIVAVERRGHHRRHRHHAQPRRRHREGQRELVELLEIGREGEGEHRHQDRTDDHVADHEHARDRLAAQPRIQNAERHIESDTRQNIGADEHHRIPEARGARSTARFRDPRNAARVANTRARRPPCSCLSWPNSDALGVQISSRV